MAVINDLPNELLFMVVSYIDVDPERLANLKSLCQVSSRFRALSEASLYRSYEWKRGRPSIRSFARTLLDRPDLPHYTRAVDFELPNQFQKRQDGPPSHLIKDELKRFGNTIDQLGLPSHIRSHWKRLLLIDEENAFAGLTVLLASQKLEELRLTYNQGGVAFIPWALDTMQFSMQQAPTANDNAFLMLHSMRLASSDKWCGAIKMRELSHIFRLPVLRHLEVAGCLEMTLGHGRPSDREWADLHSPLETLSFRESALTAHALSIILRSCKALRSFRLEIDRLGPGYHDFDQTILDEGLSYQADSLEDLCVDFHDIETAVTWALDGQGFEAPALESLGRFTQLRTVTLPPNAILPQDRNAPQSLGSLLPKCLETFELSNALLNHDLHFGQLWEFALYDLDSFPAVKCIYLHSSERLHPDWSRLKELLALRKVELVV
ncbi:hypothetical protein BDV96DRAFT_157107 [Lophiotrema nucula]|uniref:F-box domain-containing protein n=1 Tax=Lophiotrema nucula TaxID=690887 RepID=A0A6A5Z009_9PLEO|nr:hypothetical protein BDV96DRAFT_157107 [Lophiotrema nucula]